MLWVRELGQGYSAIVVRGTRAFTQAQTLAGQHVLCLDARTGETIWEHRYDLPYDPVGVYPGPRATPTLAADRLVFAAPSGMVRCLSQQTGQVLWSVNVLEKYRGVGCEFGYACSPTIVGEQVLLAVGGPGASLVSLHLDDGRELWKSGDDPASYTPLMPIKRGQRDCVVGLLQNSLVVCDLQSGRQLARIKLSDHYDEHSAWPLYYEPHLWFAAPFRAGATRFELPLFDDDQAVKTVTPQWHRTNFSNDVLSSVLVEGHVYGFDIIDAQSKTQRPSRGFFRCQNFDTGEICWSVGSERAKRDWLTGTSTDPYIGQAGIVVADGKLLMLNEIGELILARVNAERFEELARVSVLSGELVWTSPTLHRGCLYLRNHSRAVCVFVGDPAAVTSTPVANLTVSDIPQSNYVDWAGALLSIEPEYAFDVPTSDWLWKWYAVTSGMWLFSLLLGAFRARSAARRHDIDLADRRLLRTARWTGFGLSILGTTYLSRWTDEFYFTWPLALFITFDVVVGHSRHRRDTVSRQQGWQEGLAIMLLLVTNGTYFWLCRRLSLVFEWSFLAGPVGAIPLCALAAHCRHRLSPIRRCLGITLSLFAYTVFYLTAIALLRWKY